MTLCPFLLEVLDAADELPIWKRRLLVEQLVDLAGHDTLVVKKLGCGRDDTEERDFWIGVYQQFQLSEELSFEATTALSERSGRFYSQQDWDSILDDMEPLPAIVKLSWWQFRSRRNLRPALMDEIRKLVGGHGL